MSANNLNLYRTANQAQSIGNTNPVNMSRVSDKLLNAASPAAFNLVNNTKINKDSSDAAAAACRSYKDLTGLRQMASDQSNKTYYDPRCGWRYKQSTGLYPEISQGALGTAAGPSFGQPGSPDEVAGGTQWFWNLEDAEKKISAKICQNASKCKQLSLLGKYADVCGYCKSTGALIPIVGGAARYNDTTFGCARKDIVTASSGGCPANEGFTDKGFMQGNLSDAFKVREGFGNLDDLNNCMEMPLSRDCVIKVAQNAGCSPDGTLIQALKGSTGDYDSKLKTNSAYNSYNSFMPFTNGLMKDGSVASINTALGDFGRLMGNTQSGNEKVAMSARDLCVKAGEFDKYDFCSEMALDTVINENNIQCIQKIWAQNGGTKQGTGSPTLANWNGKRFSEFLIGGIVKIFGVESEDKNTNVNSIMDIVGTDSSTRGTRPGTDLPMDETTRGAETVWFDLGDVSQTNSPVVILRCDLRLKKDKTILNGEVLPFIASADELVNKYNLTNPDNKAYTSAFEIRIPPNENAVAFGIHTDDGFMLSKNQNPFENAGKGPDWGSWRYQGPSTYYSSAYSIDQGQPNIFVTKWFQGYGGAASHFWMYRHITSWVKGGESSDVYLTQEPLAPWLQFEIAARPNNGNGTTIGFFEKRWNGASAADYQGNAKSSFDTTSGTVAYQTDPKLRENVPGKKGYASFVSNSYWNTNSYFHFNAFRTLTILIRPTANLANGGVASVFHHCNFKGYSAGMYLKNNGGRYTLSYGTNQNQFQGDHAVAMNEWNLIVIQYVGDDAGVRRITVNVEALSNIQSDSGRSGLLRKLSSGRSSSSSVIIGNPRRNSLENAGILLMGALNPTIYPSFNSYVPSFTGDVAWIHGFRNYLDTDAVLNNEIIQGWISRWAIPNLPNDLTNSYAYQGCWRDSGDRALPNSLGNVNSVAECATRSKKAGLDTFGLQNHNECWGGNNTDWDRYGRLNDQGCGALGSAWNNQVYTHNAASQLVLPEKNVYGNNGSVSCERYCGGVSGGSWNGELPASWNGARCVGTPENPSLGCSAGSSSGIVCRCQKTGRGWN